MPALPPFHASVAPVTAARARALLASRAARSGPPACGTLRVSYVGFDGACAPRRARRQPRRDRRGDDGLPARSTRRASRSGGCCRSRRTAAATTARWRPTTPRRSTAATPSRRARNAGRRTPTARRSTSTTSRTRTSWARRVLPPAGRRYLDRARVPPGHGGARRRARARVRLGRLALGRPLDRLARLAALLPDGRLAGYGLEADVLEPVDLRERREERGPRRARARS